MMKMIRMPILLLRLPQLLPRLKPLLPRLKPHLPLLLLRPLRLPLHPLLLRQSQLLRPHQIRAILQLKLILKPVAQAPVVLPQVVSVVESEALEPVVRQRAVLLRAALVR
jgi:hypothetical protein